MNIAKNIRLLTPEISTIEHRNTMPVAAIVMIDQPSSQLGRFFLAIILAIDNRPRFFDKFFSSLENRQLAALGVDLDKPDFLFWNNPIKSSDFYPKIAVTNLDPGKLAEFVYAGHEGRTWFFSQCQIVSRDLVTQ